jgi:flagellar M-ring protein FliF
MPENLMQTLKKLSPKSWAMIGGSVAAGLVFLVVLMHFASSPSYTTLETGIDASQTNKITSTLAAQGIAYEVQDGGTAVSVESSKTSQARVALAGAGLLGSTQPGFSLLDKQSLGQSNFQQQVTYERALEGQLDSTIESIDGVSSAIVNLSIPDSSDQLFSDASQQTTASVLLSGSGDPSSGQVRGIAQLVASSVSGLQAGKVTITGADGSLLWPHAGGDIDSGGLPAKQAEEQHYDSTESAEINAMLAQTLGAGKAQVVVNADLDTNKATQEQLSYAKKGTPLATHKTQETLSGAGASSAAASGTSSNIPAYSAGSGSGKNSGETYANTSSNTNFGVNKTVTHSVISPGAVQQQSVSVLVDKTVPASAIPAIKKAVSNAVDLQPKRGDTLAISQIAFAPVAKTTVPAAASASMLSKYGKYGIGLLAVLFLAFAGRAIRKRERESVGEPTWLHELEAPRTLASLEASAQGPTEVAALQPRIGVAKRQIEDLVQRDPEVVAQHLRSWMAED